MSHVETIKCRIKDLDAFKAAVENIGLEFRENQKTYRWYGRSVGDYRIPAGFTAQDLGKCSHAVAIPNNRNAYEIGVVESRTEPGTYELMWDFFNGGYGMETMVGDKQASKLIQANQLEVTRRNLPRDYHITDDMTVEADGTLVVTIDGSIIETEGEEEVA